MKKPGLAALIGLAMMWGTTAAQAQLILAPTIGGGGTPPYGPGRPGIFGGSIFGNPFGPGMAVRPGIGVTLTGPGLNAGTVPGGTTNPALDMNEGFVTGHAVGFQTHRGYFLNLNAASGSPSSGGGASGPSSSAPTPPLPPVGIFGSSTNNLGKRPPKPEKK
jgi:hypothetical protein